MKKTLTTNEVADLLRADEYANWSYAGALALAEYLEDMERDLGEEHEFDAVEVRCEFAEYASAADAAADYSFEPPDGADEEEIEEAALEYLRDNTQVIEFDGGIIIRQF